MNHKWLLAALAFAVVAACGQGQNVAGPGPTPNNTPDEGGEPVAGLYQGVGHTGGVDSYGNFVEKPALVYYLFSDDGQVYRTFNHPPADGESVDAANYGTYDVQGNELVIHIGAYDTTTTLPQGGRLKIFDVMYTRQ